MCGILSIKGKKYSDAVITDMLKTLAKRGPDDVGFLNIGDTTLGQTRLSIVDVAGGHQPMKDNTLPLIIVFNGEIYGYKDLKIELEQKGYKFDTNSDTEVILKAYSEYGHDCLKYLDGMFAFALYDERTDELFVARDRFGKKPLYYTFVDKTFIGASEIKTIFAEGNIKGEISTEALHDYLHRGYVGPNKTIFKNINTLLPAHAATIKNGSMKTWKYWNLEKKEISISYEDAKIKIKELLDESVKKRMVADVEVGSLLSGGVDSTIVTDYAQKYSKTPIKTFSIGYDWNKNELPFAKQASEKIGTDHYSVDVSSESINELEEILAYMDEPHADSSDFPQHMVSRFASSKVKVALSGDGADELFMGYGWYQKHSHTPRWRPSRIFGNPYKTQQKEISIFTENEIGKILKTKTCDKFEKEIVKNIPNPIHKINAFDLKYYLPGQLLYKIDRTSMMHSLEVRSPFLDTKLAEFVYNLPTSFKISGTENKIILKDILVEIFPKDFVYRRKQGFGAPITGWLRKDLLKNKLEESLAKDNEMFKFIDANEVLRLKNDFYEGKDILALKLWNILCLSIWFKNHHEHIA